MTGRLWDAWGRKKIKELAGRRAGEWTDLTPGQIHELTVVVGLYVLVDRVGKIVHFGSAEQMEGVKARLFQHMRVPERRLATARISVLSLDPLIPRDELEGLEGKAADKLGLRGTLPGKRWPRPE